MKILYLGRKYDLAINTSKLLTKGGFCEFIENKLSLHIPEKFKQIEACDSSASLVGDGPINKSYILGIIREWYLKQANERLIEKTKHYAKIHNFPVKDICAKEQKSIWGCCDSKNNIRYNWRIIMADEELIDYLVVHEISHTIEKNHSKNFWNIVESIIPNHKALRKKLRGMNYVLKMEFK